jgi:PEGA domain
MPLVAAAALVVALAAGAVAWQRGLFASGPTLDLVLRGAPTAEVYLDGRFVGTIAGDRTKRIPAAAGPHSLKLEAAGYWPYEKNLEVGDSGEPLEVTLGKRSSLMVTVATSGAKVAVNGDVVTKPFPLELPDGQYTVDVTADGFDGHREVVALAGGGRETVTVSLTPAKKVEPPAPAPARAARRSDDDDDDRRERRARRADDAPRDSSSFNPGRQAAEAPRQGGGTNIIINPGGMPGPGRFPGFGRGFPHP